MSEIPRLNGVIAALEAGQPTFTSFATADVATALTFSTTRYDGIVFEMEHNPWDIGALRDSLQYMLNRAQIAGAGSVAPAVAPMVRTSSKCRFETMRAGCGPQAPCPAPSPWTPRWPTWSR